MEDRRSNKFVRETTKSREDESGTKQRDWNKRSLRQGAKVKEEFRSLPNSRSRKGKVKVTEGPDPI